MKAHRSLHCPRLAMLPSTRWSRDELRGWSKASVKVGQGTVVHAKGRGQGAREAAPGVPDFPNPSKPQLDTGVLMTH